MNTVGSRFDYIYIMYVCIHIYKATDVTRHMLYICPRFHFDKYLTPVTQLRILETLLSLNCLLIYSVVKKFPYLCFLVLFFPLFFWYYLFLGLICFFVSHYYYFICFLVLFFYFSVLFICSSVVFICSYLTKAFAQRFQFTCRGFNY